MNPKINIHLNDGFADVYAFATLCKYLLENNFKEEITVVYNNQEQASTFSRRVGKSSIRFFHILDYSKYQDTDIYLGGYSDVIGSGLSNLHIDLSILKNCVKPLNEDERKQLRERYEIPLEEKILVIGCPSYSSQKGLGNDIVKLAKSCSDAEVYLVGTSELGRLEELAPLRRIETRGVLRDYYAMADAALINCNLRKGGNYLHNFIEATEGGPLFLVKPSNTAQYGYKELVEQGVIRELENSNCIIHNVNEYLNSPRGEEIRESRRQHLELSRRKYLKDLHSLMNKILGKEHAPFESDLELEFHRRHYDQFDILRVIHPETSWSQNYSHANNVPIKEFSNKPLTKTLEASK
jgi:hypothetical protein